MNKYKKNVGQATVEMALVLPLFLFTVIGIFDFGRAMHAWSMARLTNMQTAAIIMAQIEYDLMRATELNDPPGNTTKRLHAGNSKVKMATAVP